MERVLEFLYKGQYTRPKKAKNPQDQASASSPPAKRAKLDTPTAPVAASNTNKASSKTIRKGSTSVAVDLNGACLHAVMFAEADYFMIPQLKELARRRFHEIFWEEYQSHFADTVKKIYSRRANYAPLKALLVRKMLEDPWLITHNVDGKLARSVPEFAVDLFAGILKRIQEEKIQLEIVYKDEI